MSDVVQHLLYFWAVARRGTVAAAAEELRLSGPTLSAQIRKLEESLGDKLLRRSGRRLVLTDAGREVMQYADTMLRYASERRLKRLLFTLPGIPVALMARFVDWLTPVPYAIATPLVGGLQSDSIVLDEAARQVFPEVKLIPYEEALERAKRIGRNGFVVYAHSAQRESNRRRLMSIADDVVAALDEQRLQVDERFRHDCDPRGANAETACRVQGGRCRSDFSRAGPCRASADRARSGGMNVHCRRLVCYRTVRRSGKTTPLTPAPACRTLGHKSASEGPPPAPPWRPRGRGRGGAF